MGFGTRLRAKRQEAGLTQEELGKGLGTDGKDVGKAVVYGWEKEQHFPKVDQLELMCRAHQWSADFLVLDKVSGSDMQPEVAEIASAISQLPKKQRDWVLMTVRQAVELAQESLEVNANRVTRDTVPDSVAVNTSSQRRRSA